MKTGFDPATGQRLLGIITATELRELNLRQDGYQRPPGLFAAPPPATLLPGVSPDISNWDAGTVSGSCFRQAGVQRAYIGVQNVAIAESQFRELSGAGIDVQSPYCFHYYGNNTQPQRVTTIAIQKALDWRCKVVTLDAEADDTATSPAHRNTQLRECVRMVKDAGLHPRIYTAAWWWVPMHGNTTEFSETCDLWHAGYGANDCRMSPIRLVNYGGWTYCVIHQYCSNAGMCGRDVRDANHVWSDSLIGGEEPGLSQAELDKVMAELNRLKVATFAGGEYRDGNGKTQPFNQRLGEAEFQIKKRTDGEDGVVSQSPADTAQSAEDNVAALSERLDQIAGQTPGGLVPHRHASQVGDAIPN